MIETSAIQNPKSKIQNHGDAFVAMDRMYHLQRYFYDFTRKYYLLGRDRLIDEMEICSGDSVLEIGCGTGRNLILLARRHPHARLFGLDASAEMLRTAEEKIAKTGRHIELKTALASDFGFDATFSLEKPFDAIFFSYSISMIPAWRESIDNALVNLKPGGSLYIVDFYDQEDLPNWFKKLLQAWLKKFHIQFWRDLLPYLKSLETGSLGTVDVTPLFSRYSFTARFQKEVDPTTRS